jgi:streptogramin lyase
MSIVGLVFSLLGRGVRRPRRSARFRPQLTALESRWLPSTITEFPLPPLSFGGGLGAAGVTGGPDGNVWFSDPHAGAVGRITPDGQVTEFATPGITGAAITTGPDGNLWFLEDALTSSGSPAIGRITPAGQFTKFTLPDDFTQPSQITAGPDGNVWFTEWPGEKVGKINPRTGAITEYPTPTALSSPFALTAGPDGNLWFTEHDAHKIGRITPAGVVTEFPVGSGGDPGSIAEGPDGNLWFTEAGGANAIGRVTPTGGVSEYAVPTAVSDPTGITAGPDKNLWFTELSTNKIGRVSDLAGGGTVGSGDLTATAPLSGNMACTKDADCVSTGKACGGDVCSYATATHVCALAVSGDPGWCTADADCWCKSAGATCNATTHHCSATM